MFWDRKGLIGPHDVLCLLDHAAEIHKSAQAIKDSGHMACSTLCQLTIVQQSRCQSTGQY